MHGVLVILIGSGLAALCGCASVAQRTADGSEPGTAGLQPGEPGRDDAGTGDALQNRTLWEPAVPADGPFRYVVLPVREPGRYDLWWLGSGTLVELVRAGTIDEVLGAAQAGIESGTPISAMAHTPPMPSARLDRDHDDRHRALTPAEADAFRAVFAARAASVGRGRP